MNPLLEQFVIESRDFLESIAQGLLTLEREPGNSEAIDELFRGVHTLKGNSGLFPEYAAFTHLVHAGEDLLDAVRDGLRPFDPEVADRLLECMDIVSAMLDCIESGRELAPSLCEGGKELAVALRALRAGPVPVAAVPPAAAEAPLEGDVAIAADAAQATTHDSGSMHFRYTPEPGCFFKGDDPLFTAINAPGLLRLSVSAVRPWADGDDFDPYDCNLLLEGWCEADREALEEHFRYVPDQVEFDAVAANSGQALAAESVSEPTPDAVDTLAGRGLSEEEEAAAARILRAQYETLARSSAANCEGVWRSVACVLRGLATAHGIGSEHVDEALDACLKTDSGDPLARVLDRMAAGTRTGETPPPSSPRAGGAVRLRVLSDDEAALVERILASHAQMLDGEPLPSVLLAAGTALAGMRRYEGRADDASAIAQLAANADAAGLRQVIAGWHGGAALAAATVAAAKPAPAAARPPAPPPAPAPAVRSVAPQPVAPAVAPGASSARLAADSGDIAVAE